MGNLLASLLNSAGAMQVYNRQLAVIQNNISNANTPGYVKQTQELEAMHLDLSQGLTGGLAAGPVLSSRSEYAEQGVRTQLSHLGLVEQKAGDLSQVSPLFNLNSETGVAGSINRFFNSFSQLSLNPNDALTRQSVLNSAQGLTEAFNETAAGLSRASHQAGTQIVALTGTINSLAQAIRDVNANYRQDIRSASDAGLDAKMHASLEQLSEVADVTIAKGADGTISVYLGGQTPLVIGDRQFPISADLSSNSGAAILDSEHWDITTQIRSGQLAGALEERNDLIPSYEADLDNLAGQFTLQINQQLAAGIDATGATPATDLFFFDPAAGAASMRTNALTPDQIAAATASGPGGNANALDIAAMAGAKTINGYTFTEAYGNLGGRVGRDIASAGNEKLTQRGLVDQARAMRDQVSGVSLDEEAAHLLQVQRAYQASGKLMSVLNDLMDTLMQTLR